VLGTEQEPTARGKRHDNTRREIIDAAWALAEVNGIAGLSFREVARQVGMQAPSLYTYFASKDELFDAMFMQGYLELEAMANGFGGDVAGLEPVEAIEMLLVRWIRFCQASVARYQLLFTRAIPGWSPSPEAYAVSLRQYQTIAEGLAGVEIAGQEALDLFLALSAGLAAQQLANDPTGDRWVRLAPLAARMLLDHGRKS
jgi:AcrR family transcriptional regulator